MSNNYLLPTIHCKTSSFYRSSVTFVPEQSSDDNQHFSIIHLTLTWANRH